MRRHPDAGVEASLVFLGLGGRVEIGGPVDLAARVGGEFASILRSVQLRKLLERTEPEDAGQRSRKEPDELAPPFVGALVGGSRL